MSEFIETLCTMLELMRMQDVPLDELKSLVITSVITVCGVYLLFFVIKAVAVCIMAKKHGISYWWLGMVPFANYAVIGKLAGPVRIFRVDVKNMGIIVAAAFGLTYGISAVYSVIVYGGYFSALWSGALKWDEMYEFSQIGVTALSVLYYAEYILDLITLVSYFSLLYAFFSKYSPAHRFLFTIFSFIQPLLGIFILAVHKNKAYSSVEDFYKERYARRFGQTYNPYSNPYSTRENPFEKKTNDPFSDNDDGENDSPFDEFN